MTLIQYVAQNKIQIGGWYIIGIPLMVVGFKKDSYGEWCIVMSDKSLHRISLAWRAMPCEAPVSKKDTTVYVDNRKDHDSKYYTLKSRHELLCRKKLKLNDEGRSTTMRSAYINQELEYLRHELMKYKAA